MKSFKKYWIFTLIGTMAVSFYPLYMGFRVIFDMLAEGSVPKENFPKYIIPYTPIAIAVIASVVFMPLLLKYIKKRSVLIASGFSVGIFLLSELLFESKILVATAPVELLNWQMFSCYIPPEQFETRTWRAVDVLLGDYSPMFKLHFYLISIILILGIVNCLYGFAKIARTGNRSDCKMLVVQSACTALFLGLCILACFTAFFRDGEITVSPLSALLMGIFFILLGVLSGTYAGSFLLGRKKYLSVLLPSVIASLVTLVMYFGEMFLLSGHLYRYGTGFLFEAISGIVLAPVDIFIILLSGGSTAVICYLINRNPLARQRKTGPVRDRGDKI